MIHFDGFGHSEDQDADQKITMEDVAEACSVLIRHVMEMGSDDAVLTVKSLQGGSSLITVKIVDHEHDDS